MKVVTLGPTGTFSHEAAKTIFSDAEIELAPNFDNLFGLIESGSKIGFVPFENSLHGSVDEVLDLLVETEAKVWRTHDVSVHHALGARNPETISTIASHPQALAQCRKYLKEHYPNAERFPVSSTAYAIELAIEDPTVAAIAAKKSIEEGGLTVIEEQLQQNGNTTRFAVIAKEDPFPEDEKVQMGIVFQPTGDFPGLLHHILTPFKIYDINLTLIENRPTGEGFGHYQFYLHFEGTNDNPRIQQALNELREGGKVKIVKELGEWYTA